MIRMASFGQHQIGSARGPISGGTISTLFLKKGMMVASVPGF